jgi:hypothetical protein
LTCPKKYIKYLLQDDYPAGTEVVDSTQLWALFSDFQVALIMTSKDNKSVDLTNNMCISMGISSHKKPIRSWGVYGYNPCPLTNSSPHSNGTLA